MVGDNHTFDHVRQNGDPRPASQSDRDDCTIGATAKRAIDTDESRRAPKTGTHQPVLARLTGERAGG